MDGPGLVVGGRALQEDANNRTTNQHLAQLMAMRALVMQQDAQDRARAMGANQRAGGILANMLAGGQQPPMAAPQFAGLPEMLSAFQAPTGPAPQAPMPGEASVPMTPPGAPPMAAPGGIDLSMPPDETGGASPSSPAGGPESQAAPMPDSWQPSPIATPELGGTAGPDAGMGNAGQGIGMPPPMPKIPAQMLSVPLAIKEMQKAGMPPEQMVDTLNAMLPIIEKDNRQAVGMLQAEVKAENLKRQFLETEIKKLTQEDRRVDINSKVARRDASAALGENRLSWDKEKYASKMAQASSKAASGGGGGPVELTPGGLRVASELTAAGMPLPGGFSRAGQSRGNAIINQLALDQEAEGGGAGSGSVASGRASFKSDQSSQAQIQKRVDGIEAASKKIDKDITTMMSTLDKGQAGSVTLINKPMNALRTQFSDPELTKFALAVKQVGVEYERMINGGLLSVAQLHEGAREDAAKIVNENMTPQQIKAVVPVMLQEISNARNANHEQLDEIKARMKTTAARPTAKAAAAPAGAPKAGDVQKGYRFNGGDPAKQENWTKVQ